MKIFSANIHKQSL